LILLLAYGLEWWVGDPSNRWHPVAWFGRWATWCEAFLYASHRKAGVAAWCLVLALVDALGVDTACILIAAGAQAVIEVIFQAMNWHSIAIEVPCYCEPIRCAQRAGVDVRAFEQGESMPDSDMFWVTSPSSPPGLEQGVLEGLGVVLDESYMPFEDREKLGLKRDRVLADPATAPPDFSAHRILVRTFPEWPQWTGRIRLGFPGSEEAWKRLEACLCPSL